MAKASSSGTKKVAAGSYERVEVRSRDQLRRWLAAHHATSRGVWVVAFKKHMGQLHVDQTTIGEEALCFGWVDSKVAKLDDARSMLLITPRKPNSAWSRVNKERIARLTRAGLMMPAGLAAVALAKKTGTWTALDDVENLTLPDDLLQRFAAAERIARTHFDTFPRSVKRAILEWIQGAKRAETRARRIDETVTLAAKNVRANQWRE